MPRETLLDDAALAAYATRVQAMDDAQYVSEASDQILAAGYERRHSASDQRTSVLYREAVKRGRLDLYRRAYRDAAARAGIELEPEDRMPIAA